MDERTERPDRVCKPPVDRIYRPGTGGYGDLVERVYPRGGSDESQIDVALFPDEQGRLPDRASPEAPRRCLPLAPRSTHSPEGRRGKSDAMGGNFNRYS